MSGALLTIVESFSGIDVLRELDGPNIHKLSNGLTLAPRMHHQLDDLIAWFEEIPVSDAWQLMILS